MPLYYTIPRICLERFEYNAENVFFFFQSGRSRCSQTSSIYVLPFMWQTKCHTHTKDR